LIGGLLKGKTGAIVGGLIGGGAGTGYVLVKERDDDDRWRGRYRYNRFRRFDNRNDFRVRSYDYRGYRGFRRR
jgi:hypothetical protein